jgi:hypothetical protein
LILSWDLSTVIDGALGDTTAIYYHRRQTNYMVNVEIKIYGKPLIDIPQSRYSKMHPPLFCSADPLFCRCNPNIKAPCRHAKFVKKLNQEKQ